MRANLDAYLKPLSPAERNIVQAVRQVVQEVNPEIEEYWPYGGTNLFFRLNGALAYLNHGHTLKLKEPQYIGFTKGKYFEDVSGLLLGRGTHKVIRYVPLPDVAFVHSEPFLEVLNVAVQYNLGLRKSKSAR